MEQKQLDEIDETFFGEEFVDDESDSVTIKSAKEGSKAMNSKKNVSNTKKKPVVSIKIPIKKSKIEVKTSKSVGKLSSKESSPKIEVIEESHTKDEIKIETIKSPVLGPVEISSPINPWAQENTTSSGSSFFTQASTWKAITGMVIILLLVSVFTQGFRFTASPSSGSELSLEDAEAKALDYVNNKLLQPPYVAEVESTQAVDDLYLVRLSVAGQSVDSYITKDGSLFFPQGFDTTKSLEEQTAVNTNEAALEVNSNVVDENIAVIDTNSESPSLDSESNNINAAAVADITSEDSAPVAEPSSDAVPTGPVVDLKMTSRKWMFFPQKVTVKAGSPIKLTITPDNSNPTFALSTYTFSIPQLGVEKEISGQTTVEFTPQTPGSYPFSCGSCEDWRGMNGVLVVQ